MIKKLKTALYSLLCSCLIFFPWNLSPGHINITAKSLVAPRQADAVPLLTCDGIGSGGDLISQDGIRFSINQSFSSIVVRLATTTPQSVTLTAVLRDSNSFTGVVVQTVSTGPLPLNSPYQTTPYQPVEFDFSPAIQVSSQQTFTLKLYSSNPGQTIFFEVSDPTVVCVNAVSVNADPNSPMYLTPLGSPMGFKVLTANPSSIVLSSPFVSTPPRIDGKDDYHEWTTATSLPFDNGTLSVVNDAHRIYFLIDVTGEPVNSPGDTVSLSFDVNRDGIISPTDMLYQINPTTGNLRYAYYANQTAFQSLTYSSRAEGFGCFTDDNSLVLTSVSPNILTTCQKHRLWELAIDMGEIQAAPGQTVNFGFQVSATSPAFTNTTPTGGLTDASHYIVLNLAPAPTQEPAQDAGSSIALDTQPLEVTQAIQDLNNSLPLVAGKATVARIYVHSTGSGKPEPGRVYLFGNQAGIDLPGSPLEEDAYAPAATDRSQWRGTANFSLPTAWTNTPGATFTAAAVDQLGHAVSSASISLTFNTQSNPTYWIIPVNTGSSAYPILPDAADIASQESYLSTVFPVKTVHFIPQSWMAMGMQTMDTVLGALNDFYNATLIAYQTTAQGGKTPFQFPDQLFGFTPSGAGQADPTWTGGSGRIAFGYFGSSQEASLAHTIQHNLDRSTNGTWGRNVPNGCGTQDTDPAWPSSTSTTGETGLDTRTLVNSPGGSFTVVPPGFPDFMSHCQSNSQPTQWISPYRWKHLQSALLPGQPSQPTIQQVYYVSGYIARDSSGNITGHLNPLIVQPGVATPNPGSGNYSIVFITSSTANPMVTFPIQFMDDPEESIDQVYFNFQIPTNQGPDPAAITNIYLKTTLLSLPLDSFTISQGDPIALNINSPQAGTLWNGVQTVIWNSTSAPGTVLQYTLLYSPDNGSTWFPVASGINQTYWQVDTTQLPGSQGQTAMFKLIATDGLNTTYSLSGAFTLSMNAPQVQINTPQDGQYIDPGLPVELSGSAYDVQDGFLPGQQLVWMENDILLGLGQELTVYLSPGTHTLTLDGINSEGLSATAAITIDIGYPTYLPVIQR